MSRATVWGTIIAAALAASSTIAAAYIGASANKDSGEKPDLLKNIQVGFNVMLTSEQKTVVQQQATQTLVAATEVKPSLEPQDASSQASGLAGEQCDDKRRRNDKGRIAELSGTKDITFTIDASPCKRRIFLSLKGSAISTADSGARTADFIVVSGTKELCKANARLKTDRGSNVEFNSGFAQRCEIMLEAYANLSVHAFVSDINKADPASIGLVLSAEAI